MLLIFKGLLGAIIVIVISLISKSKFYYIAGLLPLFPTFAVIAHLSAHSSTDTEKLHNVIVFGFFSIIPYCVYLLTMLVLNNNKFSIGSMLFISVISWSVASAILIKFWSVNF